MHDKNLNVVVSKLSGKLVSAVCTILQYRATLLEWYHWYQDRSASANLIHRVGQSHQWSSFTVGNLNAHYAAWPDTHASTESAAADLTICDLRHSCTHPHRWVALPLWSWFDQRYTTGIQGTQQIKCILGWLNAISIVVLSRCIDTSFVTAAWTSR